MLWVGTALYLLCSLSFVKTRRERDSSTSTQTKASLPEAIFHILFLLILALTARLVVLSEICHTVILSSASEAQGFLLFA